MTEGWYEDKEEQKRAIKAREELEASRLRSQQQAAEMAAKIQAQEAERQKKAAEEAAKKNQ